MSDDAIMDRSFGLQSDRTKQSETRILATVTDVFGDKFDGDVIRLILEECNWKEDIAIDRLCQLAMDDGDSASSHSQPIGLDIIACGLLDSNDEANKAQQVGSDLNESLHAHDNRNHLPSDSTLFDATVSGVESGVGGITKPSFDYSELFQQTDGFSSGTSGVTGTACVSSVADFPNNPGCFPCTELGQAGVLDPNRDKQLPNSQPTSQRIKVLGANKGKMFPPASQRSSVPANLRHVDSSHGLGFQVYSLAESTFNHSQSVASFSPGYTVSTDHLYSSVSTAQLTESSSEAYSSPGSVHTMNSTTVSGPRHLLLGKPSVSTGGLSVHAAEFKPKFSSELAGMRQFVPPSGQSSHQTVPTHRPSLHFPSNPSNSSPSLGALYTTVTAPSMGCSSTTSSPSPLQRSVLAARSSAPSFSGPQSEQKNPALERIKQHITNSKRKLLVLMRGLPGSGKSYLAKKIQGSGQVFSTDAFFMHGDVYEFNPNQLGNAHAANQKKVQKALDEGVSPVIVDNTNLMLWEMLPYAEMAYTRKYTIEVLQPLNPWSFQPKRLAKCNTHGVSIDSIKRMKDRYESVDTSTLLTYLEKKYSAGQTMKKGSKSIPSMPCQKSKSKPIIAGDLQEHTSATSHNKKARAKLHRDLCNIRDYCLKLQNEGAKEEEIDAMLFMAQLANNEKQDIKDYLERMKNNNNNDKSKSDQQGKNQHLHEDWHGIVSSSNSSDETWTSAGKLHGSSSVGVGTIRLPVSQANNTSASWERPQPQQPKTQAYAVDSSLKQDDDKATGVCFSQLESASWETARPQRKQKLRRRSKKCECEKECIQGIDIPVLGTSPSDKIPVLAQDSTHQISLGGEAASPLSLSAAQLSESATEIDVEMFKTHGDSMTDPMYDEAKFTGTCTQQDLDSNADVGRSISELGATNCAEIQAEAAAGVCNPAVTLLCSQHVTNETIDNVIHEKEVVEASSSFEEKDFNSLTGSQVQIKKDTATDPAQTINQVTYSSSDEDGVSAQSSSPGSGLTQELSSDSRDPPGALSSCPSGTVTIHAFSACCEKRARKKNHKASQSPFLDESIKQQLSADWSSFKPENQIADVPPPPSKYEEGPLPADFISAWTQTEGRDLSMATKGISPDTEEGYKLLLANKGYVCSEGLPAARSLGHKQRLDKSTMVDIQSQPAADWLYDCFPGVAVAHLNEVLEVCGGDVQMAVELMFEWGDSTPITPNDKRQLSDGIAEHRNQSRLSSQQAPVQAQMEKTGGTNSGERVFQPPPLLDLCMKHVPEKGRLYIEQQIIDNSEQRLQMIERSVSHEIRSLSLDEIGGAGARMDLPDDFSLADFASSSESSRESSERGSAPDIQALVSEEDWVRLTSDGMRVRAETCVVADKACAFVDASVSEPALDSRDAHDMDANLSLPLPHHLVGRLEQLFGPLPLPNRLDSTSDVTVHLDLDLAYCLYEGLFRSLSPRQPVNFEDERTKQLRADEALAQQLQEEEELNHSLAASSQTTPTTAYTPSPRRQRKRFSGTRLSGLEVKPARLQCHTEPVNLHDIMEEELLRQQMHERQVSMLEATNDHIAIATKLKREKLHQHFPGIDERFLEEIFQANGYILETTVSVIEGALGGREPVPHRLEMATIEADSSNLFLATQNSITDKYTSSKSDDGLFQRWDALEHGKASYKELRQEALLHYKMRQDCLAKACEAHCRSMKQVASFYSRQAFKHSVRMKEANARASEKLLEMRQAKLDQEMTLDLHGFHVVEAIHVLRNTLKKKQQEFQRMPMANRQHLCVITGKGRHSHGGVAKIRPAVISYLHDNGYRFIKRAGLLKVFLQRTS